jgi:hypothetical protein
MQKSSRKKKYVAAAAILLVGGSLATGGALVTQNSTIAGNWFGVDTSTEGGIDPEGGELVVTGDPMSKKFTGLVANESTTAFFQVSNTSTVAAATFDINTVIDASAPKAAELAGVLQTRVTLNGTEVSTGSLAAMAVPGASQITLQPGTSTSVKVEVYVPSPTAFQAAGFTSTSEVTADFAFDAIFVAAS